MALAKRRRQQQQQQKPILHDALPRAHTAAAEAAAATASAAASAGVPRGQRAAKLETAAAAGAAAAAKATAAVDVGRVDAAATLTVAASPAAAGDVAAKPTAAKQTAAAAATAATAATKGSLYASSWDAYTPEWVYIFRDVFKLLHRYDFLFVLFVLFLLAAAAAAAAGKTPSNLLLSKKTLHADQPVAGEIFLSCPVGFEMVEGECVKVHVMKPQVFILLNPYKPFQTLSNPLKPL